MDLIKSFQDLPLENLVSTAERLKHEGWRCVQMLCVKTDSGIDLTYTFTLDNTLANYQIRSVTPDTVVPSIQNLFLAIFPFENEAKDLFGVNIDGMVLDFAGHFYAVSETEPMTILTPEAKARKDKEAKKAAAAAAKAESKKSEQSVEDIEAKLAGMDPEKAAKVRAAMEAKAKKETKEKREQSEADLEAKLAGMDPEKAAKVRAAMEAKAAKEAEKEGGE